MFIPDKLNTKGQRFGFDCFKFSWDVLEFDLDW